MHFRLKVVDFSALTGRLFTVPSILAVFFSFPNLFLIDLGFREAQSGCGAF